METTWKTALVLPEMSVKGTLRYLNDGDIFRALLHRGNLSGPVPASAVVKPKPCSASAGTRWKTLRALVEQHSLVDRSNRSVGCSDDCKCAQVEMRR